MSNPNDADLAPQPEAEYVELEDGALDDEPHTIPDRGTVQAERFDAARGHIPDRVPTDDEIEAAERGAAAAPDVSEPYEEALRSGADAQGEGRLP